MEQVALLKFENVVTTFDISHSTVYRLIKKKMFPLPVKLGGKTQRWRSDELEQWFQNLDHGLVEGVVGIPQIHLLDTVSISTGSSQKKPFVDQITLLKLTKVQQILDVSRSTIYRFIKSGRFPLPVKIAGKIQRWRSDELQNWILELEHGLIDEFSGIRPQDMGVLK